MRTERKKPLPLRHAALAPALVAALLLACPTSALCAPNDDTVGGQALANMTPAEIAKLIHADRKTWVAKTTYPDMPLGHDFGGIELYAMAEPASGRICSVDALSVSVDKAQSASDEIRYRVAAGPHQAYFAVAEGFDAKAGEPDGAALADACHRTAVLPDFMSRTGAQNLFDAPSAEIAGAGVRAVGILSAAAGRKAEVLPFALACDSRIPNFCEDPRGALAKVLVRRMESIKPCPEAQDRCLTMDGFFDGHSSCTLHVDFRAKDMNRIDRAQLSCAWEPVF